MFIPKIIEKFILIICVLFISWFAFSYCEVLGKNLQGAPLHKYNFFTIFIIENNGDNN